MQLARLATEHTTGYHKGQGNLNHLARTWQKLFPKEKPRCKEEREKEVPPREHDQAKERFQVSAKTMTMTVFLWFRESAAMDNCP